MRRRNLKVAGLVLGLVVVGVGLTARGAAMIDVTVTDARPLQNIWFVARPVGGGYALKNQFGVDGLTPANFGPGGGTFSFPDDIGPVEAYTIVGDYHDATGAGHVTVGFADPTLAVGMSFAAVFPGFDENLVVRDLDSRDYTGTLRTFLPGLAYNSPSPLGPPPHGYGGPLGSTITMVDFSNGLVVGTVNASATPEPTVVVLFTVGLLLVAATRRPRASAISARVS